MMKYDQETSIRRSTLIVVFMLSVFLACSKDYSNLPQMSVDFKWPEANTYETSPEIILDNVPDSAKSFKIKMYDLDHRWNHGGGTIEYDGSNVIPEGALKKYEGPAPFERSTRFELSVKALDENGNVIAFGKKIKEYMIEPI
jgi:hypothetical protein